MDITLCNCPFNDIKNFRFCGSDVIESEICFVPAVKKSEIENGSVTFSINKDKFRIELVCCNYIVVCGFITKKITYCPIYRTSEELQESSSRPPVKKTAEKDIPVQIKIPVTIYNADDLDIEKWQVEGVEVCSSGCTNLVCPGKSIPDHDKPGQGGQRPCTEKTFHTLVEKDIVSVLVTHVEYNPC